MQLIGPMLQDFTLPGDCGVIVHNMGDGELVLEQRDETKAKRWDRVALSLDDLRAILAVFDGAKNTDRDALGAVAA